MTRGPSFNEPGLGEEPQGSTTESLQAERRQLIDKYGEAAVIRIGDWGRRSVRADATADSDFIRRLIDPVTVVRNAARVLYEQKQGDPEMIHSILVAAQKLNEMIRSRQGKEDTD